MRTVVTGLCVALVSAACSEPAVTPPYPDIDPTHIRTHVERLTAAEAAGAEAGGRGERIAVEYLTSVFTEMGLKVHTQDVPLTRIETLSSSMSVSGAAGSRALQVGDEFVAWTRRRETLTTVDAEVVFVGYGISTPRGGWDDYKDVDVRGKILLMLIGDPQFGHRHLLGPLGRDYYGRRAYKFEEAERRGAAGTFLIHLDRPEESWDVIASASRELLDLGTADEATAHQRVEGWLTAEAARGLLTDAGLDFDELSRLASHPNFIPVTLPSRASVALQTAVSPVTSTNVIAVLEGSGPSQDHVLYSSNWNGLPEAGITTGRLTDEDTGEQPPGAAIVLEVARALMREAPLPASFVFLTVTAESDGLLGLEHYLNHPILPLTLTRAALHKAGFHLHGTASHVSFVSSGYEALRGLVREEASEQFRSASADTDPNRLHFFGSGQALYTESEVPSIFLRSRLSPALREEPNPTAPPDMSAGVLDAGLLFHVGLRVASAGNWPEWKPFDLRVRAGAPASTAGGTNGRTR